jgi:hypothetical protein
VGDVYYTRSYTVWINVHNKGDAKALNTVVTLSYAPIGGGVSWKPAGEYLIPTILVDSSKWVKIPWTPELPREYCLRAVISNADDMNPDNNIGVLAVDVVEYSSPGVANFTIGNPTDTDDYVLICVRQHGNYSNIWNATILEYSSQAIKSAENETVSFQIDPGPDVEEDEWRLFTADVYVNGALVGGVTFNATKAQPTPTTPTTPTGIDPVMAGAIGVSLVLAVVVIIGVAKRRGKTS